MQTPLLTEIETASLLAMRPQTLRKWRMRGRGLSYLKLGGRVRYRRDDVEQFLRKSRVVPAERKRRTRRSK